MREVEVVITPNQAKQALHLHWGARLSDAPHHLAIVTDALETIANLNWKYEVQDYVDGELRILCVCDTLENAQEKVRCAQVSNPRIVRRLESEEEVVR